MAVSDLVLKTSCKSGDIPVGYVTISDLSKETELTEQEVVCRCKQLVSEGKLERKSYNDEKGATLVAFKEVVSEKK